MVRAIALLTAVVLTACSSQIQQAPGDILQYGTFPGAPAEATATRILYASTAPDGSPIAVSGLVIVPATPAPPDGRPSWRGCTRPPASIGPARPAMDRHLSGRSRGWVHFSLPDMWWWRPTIPAWVARVCIPTWLVRARHMPRWTRCEPRCAFRERRLRRGLPCGAIHRAGTPPCSQPSLHAATHPSFGWLAQPRQRRLRMSRR